MLSELSVPLLPEREIPQLGKLLALCDRDVRGRLVGVRGENYRYLAVDTLGKECHRFRVERSHEVLFVDGLEVFGKRTGDLDIAGAERHAAQGGVKDDIRTFEVRNSRVLAAVLFPRFIGNDELPSVLEMVTIYCQSFPNGRDPRRGHQGVGTAQGSVEHVREVTATHDAGIEGSARLPLRGDVRRNERIVRAPPDDVHNV